MIIGYIFEKEEPPQHSDIKHIRMLFVDQVSNKFGSVNCSQITKLAAPKGNCADVVSIVADALESTINKFI